MEINFTEFPMLETERLVLRKFDKMDINDIYELRTCERVMKYMDAPPMESLEETERFLNYILKTYEDGEGINWVISLKGSERMIGYIGFWRFDRGNYRGEIGYALKKDFWNMGLMSEAVNRIIKFAFESMPLNSIEGNVNPFNIPSIKLLEKSKFNREGYFRENYYFDGKFIDTITFSMIKKDYLSRML
jgi:ribosomal-protein-alanine N-acetyltransferase